MDYKPNAGAGQEADSAGLGFAHLAQALGSTYLQWGAMIPDLLNKSLGFNVYQVSVLFRRELVRALRKYRMTPEQWQVMVALWHAGHPLSQIEIGEVVLKDKPTVSRIIVRLAKNDWIKRFPSPEDGRVTLIQPTPRGMELEEEVKKLVNGHFKPLLASIPAQEQEACLKTLFKIRQILEPRA